MTAMPAGEVMALDSERYEEVYLRLSGTVERLVIRIICVLLGLLLIAQCLLRLPEVRKFVGKVEKLEGRPYIYKWRAPTEPEDPSK